MSFQSKCPQGFKENIFQTEFLLPKEKCDKVWNLLQKRETFTQGQIPPYRVEFDSDSQFGKFEKGELNIHHGPFLSVHGAIGEISDTYRDLQYFYGSYIVSFRWIRPVRLEFFREENTIKLKIHCYLKPWIQPFWVGINTIFWKFFGITFLF